jgi:hypothetical protein
LRRRIAVVMLGEEEAEEKTVLLLAIDTWSQRRMMRKLSEFETLVEKLERGAFSPAMKQLCREVRALAITLRCWLKEAIHPAGFVEVREEERSPTVR